MKGKCGFVSSVQRCSAAAGRCGGALTVTRFPAGDEARDFASILSLRLHGDLQLTAR